MRVVITVLIMMTIMMTVTKTMMGVMMKMVIADGLMWFDAKCYYLRLADVVLCEAV